MLVTLARGDWVDQREREDPQVSLESPVGLEPEDQLGHVDCLELQDELE